MLTLEYIHESLRLMQNAFRRTEREARESIVNQGFGIGDTEDELNEKRIKHAQLAGALGAFDEMMRPFEREDARVWEEKQSQACERMMHL